jgi:hypothetical protein
MELGYVNGSSLSLLTPSPSIFCSVASLVASILIVKCSGGLTVVLASLMYVQSYSANGFGDLAGNILTDALTERAVVDEDVACERLAVTAMSVFIQ